MPTATVVHVLRFKRDRFEEGYDPDDAGCILGVYTTAERADRELEATVDAGTALAEELEIVPFDLEE